MWFSEGLRFRDVVSGFQRTTPMMENPMDKKAHTQMDTRV